MRRNKDIVVHRGTQGMRRPLEARRSIEPKYSPTPGARDCLTQGKTSQSLVLEARVGIEPTHKGFADLSLTSWVPRPETISIPKLRQP